MFLPLHEAGIYLHPTPGDLTSPPAPLRDGEGCRKHRRGGNLLGLAADNPACLACCGPEPSWPVLCDVHRRPQNGCFGSSYVTGRSCTPNSAVNTPSDLL